MGCGSGTKDPISIEIDQQIRQDKLKLGNTNRLLLLGPGESGKSTFAKQLYFYYGKRYTQDEILNYKLVIHENVIYSIKNLIYAARAHNIVFQDSNLAKIEELLKVDFVNFSENIGKMIKEVYLDPAISQAFEHYTTFHLLDSAQYYFDNIDRIIPDDYIPTEEDITRSRRKTSGIQETILDIGPEERLIVIDVGGQKSERKKWAMCFNDITCMIFITAISEYDINLIEDKRGNRMLDALQLFADILDIPYFFECPTVLFLNKMDLFSNKIEKNISIKVAFPEYDGPCKEEDCFSYISDKFKSIVRSNKNVSRKFYCHGTTVIDKKKYSVSGTLYH